MNLDYYAGMTKPELLVEIEEMLSDPKCVLEELDLYKSKTPHTADGVPIFVGSRVWRKTILHERESLIVQSISGLLLDGDTDDGFSIITDHRNCIQSELYSTREALQAAMDSAQEGGAA